MIVFPELTQKPQMHIPPLKAGVKAKLTCKIPGNCVRPSADVVWTGIEGGFETGFQAFGVIGREETFAIMYFKPEPEHHNTELTCTVTLKGNVQTETSVILKIKCMFIYYIIYFLNVFKAKATVDLFNIKMSQKASLVLNY